MISIEREEGRATTEVTTDPCGSFTWPVVPPDTLINLGEGCAQP